MLSCIRRAPAHALRSILATALLSVSLAGVSAAQTSAPEPVQAPAPTTAPSPTPTPESLIQTVQLPNGLSAQQVPCGTHASIESCRQQADAACAGAPAQVVRRYVGAPQVMGSLEDAKLQRLAFTCAPDGSTAQR
jgi:phosphoribosylcarboxyaminoimidazole (NCAIR) mutase